MDPSSLLRRGWHVTRVAVRNAPRQFAAGGGGAALYAVMTVLSSLVLGRVTDRVILPAFEDGVTTRGTLALAATVIVGVGVLKGVGVVGRRLGAYAAQYRLQADFRRRVTRRYLDLPIEWHRRHSTGALMSNANSDIEAAFFIAAPLPMSFAASAMLVITGVLLVVTDPLLAAIGFTVGPAIAFVNGYFGRRMRAAAEAAQAARADVSGVAHESFDGAIVVKTMGREAAETARFRVESERLRDDMIAFARVRARFDPLMEALPNVAVLLVLLAGAWRVEQGVLSAGDLVTFAYLFRLVALPMRVFGWLLGELPRSIVGLDRVQRVLDEQGSMAYGDTRPTAGAGGAQLATARVTYEHPATRRADLADAPAPAVPAPAATDAAHALDTDEQVGSRGVHDVTFDVPAGRTVAVVGPTGSGKTTLATLLVRLFDPDDGTVHLDGVGLPDLERAELAEQAAIVFQEPFVFDDTVRGNVTLGRDVAEEDVLEALRLAGAEGFVAGLPEGLDTEVGERGSTLSGGQRQRIALARALVRRPRLLVLDDATSAVDAAVEAEILANLRDAAMPSTVVIVAYRTGSIALADEVVFLRDGRIEARGTHEELLASVPAYAHLVTAYESAGEQGYGAADGGAAGAEQEATA